MVSPGDQARQRPTATVYPSVQFTGRQLPAPLIDPPPQGRHLQPPRAEVEGEVHYGREPPLGFGGEPGQHGIRARHTTSAGQQTTLPPSILIRGRALDEYRKGTAKCAFRHGFQASP